MRVRNLTILALGLFAARALAALPGLELPGAASGTAGASVKAQIMADVEAVKPGETFNVAVVLTTNAGWHIYWENAGEGGIATDFNFKLPEGFKAEPVRFPVPRTFVQPGGIVIYGYEGKTIFLARVTAPAQLPEGELTIQGNATWLCCNKDACVPGAAKLNLPMGKETSNTVREKVHPDVFAEAEGAMPVKGVPADVAEARTGVTKTTDIAEAVNVELAWKKDVSKVEAYPPPMENFEAQGLGVETKDKISKISFNARVLNHQAIKIDTYPLLVAYTDSEGRRHGFTVDVDLRPLHTQNVK